MSHNPNITHNSNNNYSVDIVTEPNLSSPSVIQYSSTTNTPFVTIKITPNDPQVAPVLASNIKIDDIISNFAWNESVNFNSKGICEPPPPPHNSNSSLQHVTGIGVTSSCQAQGFSSFFGNSSEPQQGPYEAQNDSATQTSQIAANGVSWSEIILIEVYEDDSGGLVNDNHSPAIAENYNEWAMWSTTPSITTNIYPVYVKAFVYLSFDTGGMSGVTSNINLNLDIDEVEPTYGCTDPAASNYDATATVDDGSCVLPPPPPPTGPLALAPPNLSLNTNTPISVIVDLDFAAATGGSGNYEYTATYQTDDTDPNAIDILTPSGSLYLTPGTVYSINILPLPTDEVDIDVVLTVTDTSDGTTVSSTNITTGGTTPSGPSNAINIGNITLARGPILTEVNQNNNNILQVSDSGFPFSNWATGAPITTTSTSQYGLTQLTVTLDAAATGGDGGPFEYSINIFDSTGGIYTYFYPDPNNIGMGPIPTANQQDPYPLDGVYNNGDDIVNWCRVSYMNSHFGQNGGLAYIHATEAEMLAGVVINFAPANYVAYGLTASVQVRDTNLNSASNFSNTVTVPIYNINPI